MSPMPRQGADLNNGVYSTPDVFMRAVKKKFSIDAFAFDFAASRENAKAVDYWTEEDNALLQIDWNRMVLPGRWGWLNPPYKRIGKWAFRCAQMRADGGRILMLVPASVGSNWFAEFVYPYAHVFFLKGRIPFLPDKPDWLYDKDCILCAYSPKVLGPVTPTIWDWRKDA